ncbi:PREDICTED: protein fuzzy homolog isoform X2 [Ceratosolen solmsi marchali]|uniref:Protein fuzzy homolog isoform X2 n=1 Tax=Ceratosolen solmsi marchali TaxID=326594 RepID=A0AAJ6YQG6_9HYME|nr:PREDICTED: protein fuzzy homolog isoform X2 [Ceratosolen solmsi marchali]
MTSHVMCLTSSGGIPLFVRKKGDGDLMTFSKIASLNGIHMFLKTHNIELLNSDMADTSIVWKEFKGCITLIAIASVVSLKDIEQPRSVEKLKRDLRPCYSIIDKLLEYLDIGDISGTKTNFFDLTDSIICSENHLLQICLDTFMEYLDSLYGCILIHNCLAVATESWWSLNPKERKLIILAITTNNNCGTNDLPIFLPYKSPNLAYRLVNVTLVDNIQVLALCGPNPDVKEIERLAFQCWRNNIEILRTSVQCYPRNFPYSISLDSRILGFLLVNYKIKKFVMSRNVQHLKNQISRTYQLDTIKTFYHYAVETLFYTIDSYTKNLERNEEKTTDQFKSAKETYWSFEYHKCHALKELDHIICVLYTSIVPTHTMRLITHKTLKIILTEKQICW